MGKRRQYRAPQHSSKSVSMIGPIALKESMPRAYYSETAIAYNLGNGGETMPAWISSGRNLVKAYNAGVKARQSVSSALAVTEQMRILREVLNELGVPMTPANVEWARKLTL